MLEILPSVAARREAHPGLCMDGLEPNDTDYEIWCDLALDHEGPHTGWDLIPELDVPDPPEPNIYRPEILYKVIWPVGKEELPAGWKAEGGDSG